MAYPVNPQVQSTNEQCMICASDSRGKPLCYQCYREKEIAKKDLPQRRSAPEVRDHYFNQKRLLYKVKNPEYTKAGMIKLVAIGEELSTFHGDWYLKQRLHSDIHSLQNFMAGKSSPESKKGKSLFDDEDFRKQFPADHLCDDGHYVRSRAEMLVDNWLYNHGIIHAYEKSVFMKSYPDAVVISDFYIPEGKVFIEFWGLSDDEKYQKRKEIKQKLYRDNKINLIELDDKDIKRLEDILPRKLHGFLPNKDF